MKELLKKLAALADQLDVIEEPDMADEVDLLMQEVADRAAAEEKLEGICETCGGSGAGVDAPWCEACGGTGKGTFQVEASVRKAKG